jgi:hypothetical protein
VAGVRKNVLNIPDAHMQLIVHFLFFGVAAGATQAQKIKNVGNCFSLVATEQSVLNKLNFKNYF